MKNEQNQITLSTEMIVSAIAFLLTLLVLVSLSFVLNIQ